MLGGGDWRGENLDVVCRSDCGRQGLSLCWEEVEMGGNPEGLFCDLVLEGLHSRVKRG